MLITLRMRPASSRCQDIWLSLLLGVVNLLANIFLLAALRVLPSAVAFSVSSAAGVTVATVTGVLLWGEGPSRAAIGGVVLTTVAVVLLTR